MTIKAIASLLLLLLFLGLQLDLFKASKRNAAFGHANTYLAQLNQLTGDARLTV